ncbi:MAG: hypothetical protein PHW04_16775 [Candidatus Wallbacteria bacterium]|nr:hypothetical protein [Candidatus Wallbacteria bacterium]
MLEINKIRKAELHCHLDGILDPQMLKELIAEGHDMGVNVDKFTSIWPVKSRAEWFGNYMTLTQQIYQNERQHLILKKHIQRLIRQNVAYTEIFVSGILFSYPTVEETIGEFRRLRESADHAAGGKIQVEFLVCVVLSHPEKFERQLTRIIPLSKSGLICGLALSSEDAGNLIVFAPGVEKARQAGLKLEAHAGEMLGPDNVWNTILTLQPDRIGHAVGAFQDRKLIDHIIRNDIHIEMMPLGNTIIGNVRSVKDHPVSIARNLGMNYSINTDDPGPQGNYLNDDYRALAELGFTETDFNRIFQNSNRSRFRLRNCPNHSVGSGRVAS